ncbi:hypothetical protein K7I13_13505 [Brucepastera parasyntrophica]|uniref:hypothetical protein n=1 Tax=Brucepastera parasyntrophica TaxID=2880008 RepID=UPI0021096574|nr:hypothetical protein [Brucepastera parasyntrophica]ULQ59474.1 hypothetical protein K7I13_13505 [Brucepastera parasyntrophica]
MNSLYSIITVRAPLLKRIGIMLAVLCLMHALPAQSFDFTPVKPQVNSARMAGFGGPYAALEAGFDTLLTNPAAFAYVSEKWSIARISANVSGPLFDLASLMDSDDLANSILDLTRKNNGIYLGLDMTGPLPSEKWTRTSVLVFLTGPWL